MSEEEEDEKDEVERIKSLTMLIQCCLIEHLSRRFVYLVAFM